MEIRIKKEGTVVTIWNGLFEISLNVNELTKSKDDFITVFRLFTKTLKPILPDMKDSSVIEEDIDMYFPLLMKYIGVFKYSDFQTVIQFDGNDLTIDQTSFQMKLDLKELVGTIELANEIQE